MITIPKEFSKQISAFAPLFSKKVFEHALVLVTGCLLVVGRRTVCSALRAVGLSQEKRFDKYHAVLSIAKWSCYKAAQILLLMLVDHFSTPSQALVFGIDETIERRRGAKIKAKGIYRDPVRSSKSHFVKCSGLRWISLMLLTPISWADRVWALPFLTVLAPSERYNEQRGKRHKKVTDWARQMILQLSRWLPNRLIIIVADSTYAAIDLLASVRNHACVITRLRLDAALYDFVPPRPAGKVGRKRKKANVSYRSSSDSMIPTQSGLKLQFHNGTIMAAKKCWLPVEQPSGIIPACLLFLSVGCSLKILTGSSNRRLYCLLTLT